MCQIELTRDNVLTLFFHLRIMRKNVKKGLKRKYDKAELKQHMLLYDSLFDALPRLSDDIDAEVFDLVLSYGQFELLKDFFGWYEKELKNGLSADPSEQERTGFEMVQDIKKKLNAA